MSTTITDDLRAGVQQHQQAAAFYQAQGESIESRIDTKIAEMDAWKGATEGDLDNQLNASLKTSITPITAFYDAGVHTKSSLNIEADPSDNAKSKWIKVPNNGSHLFCPVPGKLTLVNMRKCYAYRPGNYESPQYSNDVSTSRMQFIYTNTAATSDEINAALASDSINLFSYGGWNSQVITITTSAVLIAGISRYSRLWMRFVNVGVREGDTPQEITQFGGDNAAFSVDTVRHYPEIDYEGF